MKPSGLAFPGAETLNTATLLASALATNSISLSGVRHRLLGVLPGGASGYRPQDIVSSGLPDSVSRTLTRVELAQATKRCLPSEVSAISVGCFSVLQRPSTLPSRASTTATAASLQRLTNTRL